MFAAASEIGFSLYQIPSSGGTPKILATPNPDKGESAYNDPQILPGGNAVLFSTSDGVLKVQLAVLSLETGEQKILFDGGTQGRYLPTGHLVYVGTPGNLMAVPFDLEKLEITGDPTPVLQEVRSSFPGSDDYALSDQGTLIYIPGQVGVEHSLVWVDREGTETLVTEKKREYAGSRISPDGKQVAFSIHQGGSPHSVWIYDFERDSFSRLTFEGSSAGMPIWSPDGNWIVYQTNPDGKRNMYRQPADRTGQAERLNTSDRIQMPMAWSPDGQVITFTESGRSFRIGILPMEADGEPWYFVDSPASECCGRFSPDGKWMAYVSDELGRDQVYVRPYPEPDVKFLISGEEGGGEPVWSPDGSELFYRSGNTMMAVSVQTEPRFFAGTPTALFEGSYRGLNSTPRGYQYYDISPDGQRFLMVKLGEDTPQIQVVLNWFEELKRQVPTN